MPANRKEHRFPELQLLQFILSVVTPGATPPPVQTLSAMVRAPEASTLIVVRSLSPASAPRSAALATS